ncbi:hypothetical protein Y032_0462g1893 [Ancylostoma ceylanicum]|nr:hypothetical protein Y032_0462g1893 [Ancylostoma ceylanicum]
MATNGLAAILLRLSYRRIYRSILSYPILSYPILSYPTLSYPILSYPIQSYPIVLRLRLSLSYCARLHNTEEEAGF